MDTMTLSVPVDQSREGAAAPATRWLGAGVAFSIAFVAGLIGLGFQAPFLLLGVPAATAAGWFFGPMVRPDRGVADLTFGMAVMTIAIADALVVAASSIASLASPSVGGIDPLSAVARGLALWGIGLLFVGIPMLTVTVPCGLAWAVLVRRLARRPR